MKIKKLLVLSLLIAVGIFIRGESAFAATKTWIGTTCTASSTDCGWSESGNWQGGVIPANGDDIVIHGDSSTTTIATQDIANLVIASITSSGLECDGQNCDGAVMLRFSTNSTLTGDIINQAPSGPIPSGRVAQKLLSVSGTAASPTITLGGDVKMLNVNAFGFALNLNNNRLSIEVDDAAGEGSTYAFAPIISGNGEVNFDLPINRVLYLSGQNTYSGVTNLISLDYVDITAGTIMGMFGTSDVIISPHARVILDAHSDGDITYSNKITVNPPEVEGTFIADQLIFWSGGHNVNFIVPNITLLGNARFGLNQAGGSVTVDLTGITANGHCIQYGQDNNYVANFVGGPAACTVAVGTQDGNNVPNVPDTGFGLLLNNPAVTLSAAAVAAGAIVVMSRRMKPAVKRARR